uniref:Uncharacterized protein n=1 Tax=Anopheles dirus TaxID=7168 RepID=A0A182N1H1_9DIPT
MRPISVTSGWLVVVVALATLHYPVAHGVLSTGHGYDTKSIAQAYLECLQYLNISRQSMYAYDTDAAASPNTGANCLMRCIGLNTRWWDDGTGLNEPALVRFFRHVDVGALEQARTCLADLSALEQPDSCAAAYNAFRCYGDALGEVVAHAEYLVPRRDTIRQAVQDCAGMLQVSDEQLATCVASESFLRVPGGTRLLRCIVTRLGWYADATGVSADTVRLLMDDGTAGLWTEERGNDARRCEEDLRELGADVCQVAAQSVEICYGRQAFEALWQVLQEQYGARVEMFDAERVEQVQAANAVDDRADGYPVPKTRYRSLLIIAPDVYTVDASIPLEPMYVPLYHGAVPQRFVREVAPVTTPDAPMVPEDLESLAEDDTAENADRVGEVQEQPEVEASNDAPNADLNTDAASGDAVNVEDPTEYSEQTPEQTNSEFGANLNTDAASGDAVNVEDPAEYAGASAGDPATDAESHVVNVEDLTEYIGQPPEQTLNTVSHPQHPATAARPVNPVSGPNLMKAIQLAHILSRMQTPPAAANQGKV